MPSLICQEIYDQCIVAGANNASAQSICEQNRMANCGTLSPSNYTAPVSSSSSSASQTPTPTGGSAAASVASTSTSKAAAATIAMVATEYGSGLLAAGAAAAFGLLL
jgi:hypothetical protein